VRRLEVRRVDALPKWGAEPTTEDDRVLSLAMTDYYFDRATLEKMGQAVSDGKPPYLAPGTDQRLREQFRQVDDDP
jgi:hypothetical protein